MTKEFFWRLSNLVQIITLTKLTIYHITQLLKKIVKEVFDASCKGKYDHSSAKGYVLNPRPSLTPHAIFTTFIASPHIRNSYNGDLEKSFLQTSLAPDDRDYIRFIWLKAINDLDFDNTNNNYTVKFRVCHVSYELKSLFSLLAATFQKHWNRYVYSDPDFVEKIVIVTC